MVRVGTKYPLSEEQYNLLDEKKNGWWLRDIETGGFVRAFPRIKANEPVEIDIELADSKYCLGCGDWNVVDENGYHCSKRIYFKITNGSIRYFKSKAELDADTSDTLGQTSISEGSSTGVSYSAFGSNAKPTEQPKTSDVEEVSVDTEVAMYCVNDKKIISRNYNCVMNFNKRCEELNEEDCYNCIHGRQLFYKNIKE